VADNVQEATTGALPAANNAVVDDDDDAVVDGVIEGNISVDAVVVLVRRFLLRLLQQWWQ